MKPTFAFATPQIEASIDAYIKNRGSWEVFVVMLGHFKNGVYTIKSVFPLPNCADPSERHLKCPAPDNMERIIYEFQVFTGSRFIGMIHNHPGERSQKSIGDTEYFGMIGMEWGNKIFGVIGNRKTMRMYHVDATEKTFTISLIQGKTYLYKLLSR